jgi:hypothetical protein
MVIPPFNIGARTLKRRYPTWLPRFDRSFTRAREANQFETFRCETTFRLKILQHRFILDSYCAHGSLCQSSVGRAAQTNCRKGRNALVTVGLSIYPNVQQRNAWGRVVRAANIRID